MGPRSAGHFLSQFVECRYNRIRNTLVRGRAEADEVQTQVEFRSDRFPAYDGEEQQVNPGRWGKRLAEFLRDNLRTEGLEIDEPFAEDWGWVVPVVNKSFRLWIGCGNYQEYPDGFLCFIEPHTPVVRKVLQKVDTQERVAALQSAIDKILTEDAGIRAKRWWNYDEFNNPAR